MLGRYELNGQIDTSHRFLYGHRYWTKTKKAIEKEVEKFNASAARLTDIIQGVAITVAEKRQVERL